MAEKDEVKTAHSDGPFTDLVEQLKAAVDDEEQLDLMVKAVLARVRDYTDNTIVKGANLPPEHTQMAYEHGFTLFRRELPDSLTLPFANNASKEIERKNESDQQMYEKPFRQAFKTSFENELAAGEQEHDVLEEELGKLIMEKPGEVARPVEGSHSQLHIDSLMPQIEIQSEKAAKLYEELLRFTNNLVDILEKEREKYISVIKAGSEKARGEASKSKKPEDVEILDEAIHLAEDGKINAARELADRASYGVDSRIRLALDRYIMDHALANAQKGNIKQANAWADLASYGVDSRIHQALDFFILHFAIQHAQSGNIKQANAWAGLATYGVDSKIRAVLDLNA